MVILKTSMLFTINGASKLKERIKDLLTYDKRLFIGFDSILLVNILNI